MSEGRDNRTLVLTPPGAGAIGVVRVVGRDAAAIVEPWISTAEPRALARAELRAD